MTYAVFTTGNFDKEMIRLSGKYQNRIKKIFIQLKENPYVGDQLQIKVLREKRLEDKRIYYLVYDDLKAALVVAISDKKAQQKTINYILKYINEYKVYLKDLIDQTEN